MLIIPTYNERGNIKELVRRIRLVLERIPIMFVDDNSPDGTAAEIKELQKTDRQIFLLSRPQKLGLGSAYREAFQKVLAEDLAEYVISLDADLSHPPEALPQIIEKLKFYPVVVGSRYVQGGGVKNWHWWRRFISRASNFYAGFATGVPVRDLTSGFTGYRTEALRQIDFSGVRSEGYAFQIEMKTLLYNSQRSILEIPFIFTERREGKSKFNSKIILEAIQYTLKVLIRRIFRKRRP